MAQNESHQFVAQESPARIPTKKSCTFLLTQFIRVPCQRGHVEAIGYSHLEADWAAYPVEELSHNLCCFRLALPEDIHDHFFEVLSLLCSFAFQIF